MLRIALATWYVIAAALAPKVCCCAFHPAAEEVRPARAAAHVRAPACPHCKTADETPPAAPEPAPGKPPCPCKDGRPHEAPAVVLAPTVQLFDGPTGLAAFVASERLTAAGLVGDHHATNAVRSGPFLTTDDLLRAFHILRC